MRRVSVFNTMTLDGFIADSAGDMSWAHKQDPEWNDFIQGNARGDSTFVFGRKTYEMMASFWPTPMAIEKFPIVAKCMNSGQKIVFSRTLDKVPWNNSTLVKTNPAPEIRKLKQEPGPDMVIFGSASIISQLAQEDLIDEYRVVVNPIVLGKGKSMFDGVRKKVPLKLTNTRVFGNGNILLSYELAV